MADWLTARDALDDQRGGRPSLAVARRCRCRKLRPTSTATRCMEKKRGKGFVCSCGFSTSLDLRAFNRSSTSNGVIVTDSGEKAGLDLNIYICETRLSSSSSSSLSAIYYTTVTRAAEGGAMGEEAIT